jgi:hypothetical protein
MACYSNINHAFALTLIHATARSGLRQIVCSCHPMVLCLPLPHPCCYARLTNPANQLYSQAFCNADIDVDVDVYIAIPQGWFYCPLDGKLLQHKDPCYHDMTYCMYLVKNLYGTKQAARNWYLCLSEALTLPHHGFWASQINQRLFI